jgi:1-acyl-sn-glycerol-3-phosphate acyltransferase
MGFLTFKEKQNRMKFRHCLPITYPKDLHTSMDHPGPVEKDAIFTKDFPYYHKQWWYRLWQVYYQWVPLTIMSLVTIIRLGLKIKGRKWLWIYRKELKNGAVSIGNHLLPWDYFAIRTALWPRRQYFVMWGGNYFIKHGIQRVYSGGIPIPENLEGKKSFFKALKEVMQDGHWMHFNPEGHLYYYYQDVRPFFKGAFHLAVDNNKPIVPMGISLRPAKFIYKWFKKNIPLATIEIGEPLFPNMNLPFDEAVEDLKKRSHEAVSKLVEKNTPEVVIPKQKPL